MRMEHGWLGCCSQQSTRALAADQEERCAHLAVPACSHVCLLAATGTVMLAGPPMLAQSLLRAATQCSCTSQSSS
jgi:hypothetical protein